MTAFSVLAKTCRLSILFNLSAEIIKISKLACDKNSFLNLVLYCFPKLGNAKAILR